MNRMQIGLLLPTSTIFPIAKEFERGIKAGLANHDITFIPEFIGQGNLKNTESAITKLMTYDEADMIVGILSGRVTERIASVMQNYKKPLMISEMGEYVPNPSNINSYTFINSQHLWRQAWAIGNIGVRKWGKKGMFVGSVYDAAYSFPHMFHEGMMAADASAMWSFSIPPMPPAGQLSDMSVIFPFLEKYEPDFVFAAFCGGETTLFLNEFIRHGWHKRTRLVGLPYLLAPFEPLADDITIYTTLPVPGNPEIVPKKSFYHLGERAGKTIADALAQGGDLHAALAAQANMMQIGKGNFIKDRDTVTLIENNIKANNVLASDNTLGDEFETFALTEEKLLGYQPDLVAGWLNPYLCI